MAMPEETSIGFHDSEMERAWDLLVGQYDGHCNRAIYVLNAKAESTESSIHSEKYKCASLMILNTGISILNIKKFYNPIGLHSKDVVILFRGIFESLLNALYVLAAEPDVAQKALGHATQKRFRSHEATLSLGPYKLELRAKPLPEDVKRLIHEFTSAKGRELNWSDLTIRERIGVIASKYGDKIWLDLGVSYVSFYGHSSEYIHGSLFAPFDYVVKRDKAEFYKSMITTLWTCLIEIGMGIVALLDVLGAETGIKEFGKTSKELSGNLLFAAELAGRKSAVDAN